MTFQTMGFICMNVINVNAAKSESHTCEDFPAISNNEIVGGISDDEAPLEPLDSYFWHLGH